MNNSHIHWATNILCNNGYQIDTFIPEIIQNNAWSEVSRFKTKQGFIFLKKVSPALSLEPKIINILHNEFHANVPKIIADNHEQHCFLMADAGVPLHDYFKNNFQDEILIQTVHKYADLQIKSVEKIDLFLNMGVPDWRLEKLPALYQELIENEALLLEDGLSSDELTELKKLTPRLFLICEKLANYKIKDTFGHADLHDKNILIDPRTYQTTLIDLGEVVITHPFFSFLNCLHRTTENFSLSKQQYQHLQLACFEPWFAFETKNHLFEILEIIQKCWSIHAVLGELRLINSVTPVASQNLRKQGRLSKKLRCWINQK